MYDSVFGLSVRYVHIASHLVPDGIGSVLLFASVPLALLSPPTRVNGIIQILALDHKAKRILAIELPRLLRTVWTRGSATITQKDTIIPVAERVCQRASNALIRIDASKIQCRYALVLEQILQRCSRAPEP